MSESTSQLKVGAALDGSFETVTRTVKTKLKELSDTAKDTGDKLGGMGDGTTQAAQKVDQAAKYLISSIQRTTAVMDSGARGSVEYYKALANQRGVDSNVLKPYLDELEAVKVKQAQASAAMLSGGQSLDKIGMSAAATANALRGVPAQFTDIVTSIQGGQAPLTVFLQQGGQLKDMFGGAGNAAKALGGYVLGLINPFTLVAAGVAAAGIAYMKGAAESEAYNKALILTGSAAGVTAGQLGKMAQAVSSATGGTIGAAAEALAQLAGAGNIASAQFERVAAVAIQMEKTTGQAVKETVKEFSALGKDPLDASIKLNTEINFLTQSVYEQIKALTEQGRTFEAGALAQKAYADAMNERFPKLIENLGIAERAWAGVGGAAKKAWDQFLNIGRTGDPVKEVAAELKSAQDRLAMLVSQAKSATGYDRIGANADVASQEAIIANLKKQADYNANIESSKGRSAAYAARQAESTQAQIAFDKESDKYLSKAVQMQQAIAAAKERFAKVSQTPENLAKYTQEVEGIQKKFEETTKKATTSRAAVNQAAKDDIAGAKVMAELREKSLGDEIKRAEKSLEASEKVFEAYKKADESAAVSAMQSAIQAEAELSNYGLLKSAVQELELVRLESARNAALSNQEDVEGIEKRIAAQKRLIAATKGVEGNKANEDAAKLATKSAADAAAEWKRTSDKINDTLTDALMRGFESGKDFARNLRDTVVNMFKTLVLRPIISAIINPVAGALTGALGLSGAASAAGAAGSASTALSGLSLAMSSFGSSFLSGLSTTFASGFSTVGLAVEGGLASIATGTSAGITAGIGQALGAVALPAAAVVGVLGAFGAFRKTTKVGEGITGTLGGDNQSLNSFEEMRKSGYLFGGPKYWDELKSLDSAMAKAINTDFTAIKTAATGAATALGLSADSVAGFSKAIRLTFTGDKAKDDALYKEYMAGVSDDLAKTILGSYKETVATVIDQIQTGSFSSSTDASYSTVERQVTTSSYTPSEFAKDGETAGQTLQRLATSITLVNGTSDTLGNALLDIGLKGANTASLLIDAFGGAESYASQMGSYYTNFYSQAERTAKLTDNTSKAFAALGLVMPKLDESARDVYRSLVEEAAAKDMTVESNRAAYASLIALQGPLNELAPTFDSIAQAAKDAAEKTAQAAIDAAAISARAAEDAKKLAIDNASTAYDGLDRAINAQRQIADIALSVAQEQVAAITSVFDTLKTNVQSLYGSVGGTAAAQAAQGQAFINQALSTAQASGYLPDSAALADAISASRSGIDSAVYASQQDADFARLELAGRLDQLKTISGDQLTGAEKAVKVAQGQLDALDAMLENAKLQLDALNGISGLVLSIGEAMGAFDSAVTDAKTSPIPSLTFGPGSSGSVTPTRVIDYSPIDQALSTLDFGGDNKSSAAYSLYAAAASTGASQADIATRYGYTEADIKALFASAGIGSFAVGTNRVPYDQIAMIHEGEAIVPAAYNPANGGAVGNTARLEALIVDLTAKVAALEGPANRTATAIEGNQSRPILVEIA